MPNCVKLFDKSTKEPVSFHEVDERLCAHFQVFCDPDKWFANWYNWYALRLALGQSSEQIIAKCQEQLENSSPDYLADYQQDLRVARYLSENFTSDTWYEHK